MNNQTDIRFSKCVNTLLTNTYNNVKVFAIIAKDNVDKYNKFITFRRDSINTTSSKDRVSHSATARYTINFFAKNYADNLDLAQSFINNADNMHINDTTNGFAYSVNITDIAEDYDDTYELYVQSMSVEFNYYKS